MRRAVLLLWLLGFPATAWANDPLRRAQGLFRQMEYGTALEELESAQQVADNQPADLVAIYQLQGMCLAAEGKLAAAEQAYARLLSIDPGFRLSARISPKLAEPFYRVLNNPEEPGIRLEHQPAPDFLPGAEPALRVTLRADPMGLVRSVRAVLHPTGEDTPRLFTAPIAGPGVVVIPLKGPSAPPDSPYWLEALDQHGGVLARLGAESPFKVPRDAAAVAVAPPPRIEKGRPPPAAKPTAVRKPTPRIVPRREAVKLGFDLEATKPAPRPLPEPQKERPTAWYKRWWVWTAVGTLTLAAVIGTAVALSNQGGGAGGPVDIGISFGHR